jgi:hypothetical protein
VDFQIGCSMQGLIRWRRARLQPSGWRSPVSDAFDFLPTATLAATIIVAVLSLVDFTMLKHSWIYSNGSFWAVIVTWS